MLQTLCLSKKTGEGGTPRTQTPRHSHSPAVQAAPPRAGPRASSASSPAVTHSFRLQRRLLVSSMCIWNAAVLESGFKQPLSKFGFVCSRQTRSLAASQVASGPRSPRGQRAWRVDVGRGRALRGRARAAGGPLGLPRFHWFPWQGARAATWSGSRSGRSWC